MEKLVELLNKFEKEKIINDWWYVDEDDEYFWRSLEWWDIVNRSFDRDAHWFFKYQIISKDFKFIERLVNNNKIDRLTFCTVETPSSKYEDFDLWPETPREDYTNILLMDLAIQDDPLKFLSWIIK